MPLLLSAIRGQIGLWGFPPKTDIRLLNVSENVTLALAPPGRPPSATLRLHRPGYHTAAEIEAELAWLRAIDADGLIEVPSPLLGRDGQALQVLAVGRRRFHAVAFGFLPGREPTPEDADLPAWFERLGETTARLHIHARSWQRPPGFARETWDVATMTGPEALWGPWDAGVGLDRAGRALLGRAIDRIAGRLAGLDRGSDRFGLIHADLRLANLLVDGDTLRVIDFDDCGFGWLAYDFAAAVSFFEDAPIVPALEEAWLRGYARRRALDRESVAALPYLLLLRRILLVAWVASHPLAPTAQAMGVAYTEGALAMAEALLTREGRASRT